MSIQKFLQRWQLCCSNSQILQSIAAPVLDLSKMPYFWRIQHASIDIFKESEQHRMTVHQFTFTTIVHHYQLPLTNHHLLSSPPLAISIINHNYQQPPPTSTMNHYYPPVITSYCTIRQYYPNWHPQLPLVSPPPTII